MARLAKVPIGVKMITKDEAYVPLYKQIERKILEDISTGTYKPGERIPTQEWFVRTYGVSRVTVRQAINELTKRRILISLKGGGTYVGDIAIPQKVSHGFKEFTSNINRIGGFTSNLSRTGQSAHSIVLDIAAIECDKNLGEIFELSIGRPLITIQRLRKVNNIPVSVERTYINRGLVPELDFLKDFVDNTSLYDFLVNKGGITLRHANEQILAVTASQRIAEFLEVLEGNPILYIKRNLFTDEEQCVEYCEIYCRTDIYMFSVDYSMR